MSAKVRCGWMNAGLSCGPVLQLLSDLIGRVAALGGVALDLPADAQLLVRVEIDLDVVALAHRARGVAEQALDDDVVLGLDVFGRVQLAGRMVVDRLQDRLAEPQQAQVLLDDVDVVAARVERGDADLGPLPARIAVVVVRADRRDPLGPSVSAMPAASVVLPAAESPTMPRITWGLTRLKGMVVLPDR